MLKRALFWFRRDLRAYDNAGLSAALAQARSVRCVFVFDREILDALPDRSDRRVEFIWHSLQDLACQLQELGAALHVCDGTARTEIPRLAALFGADAVFANRDYEPAAQARDLAVAQTLEAGGCRFNAFKDQVVFERDEILSQAGRPYTVFTPYRNAWLRQLGSAPLEPWPVAEAARALQREAARPLPPLGDLGFAASNLLALGIRPGSTGAQAALRDFLGRIRHYRELRNFPGRKGVSYLSVHLRFGTVSIRELVRHALADGSDGAQCWLDELIWREFYFQILHHFPHVVQGAFRHEYDALEFDEEPSLLQAWQQGRTGYPIVDAAMRQLAQTGYMHNRLRMIAASFLVKDLLIDWRHGEAWFARQLNDFDLAANNGGWQWSASVGCDAQPWFRIFNPVTQSEKFDPDGQFIRRYVPELARVPLRWLHAPWTLPPVERAACGLRIPGDYPEPLVDHATARARALARYQAVRATTPSACPRTDG